LISTSVLARKNSASCADFGPISLYLSVSNVRFPLGALQFWIWTSSPFNCTLSSRDVILLLLGSECHDQTVSENDDFTPVSFIPDTIQKPNKSIDIVSGDGTPYTRISH
jgi:hypothetical protein